MNGHHLQKGDEFRLAEPQLNRITLRFSWKGYDVDVSALLLSKARGLIRTDDFVYFNSRKRECSYQEYLNIIAEKGRLHKNTRTRTEGTKTTWMIDARPMSYDGSVIGAEDDVYCGDSKSCLIDIFLDTVSPEIHEILLVASLYSIPASNVIEPENFKGIADFSVSIFSENQSNEIARYPIRDSFRYEKVVEVGRLVRTKGSQWAFNALCDGYSCELMSYIDLYA